MNNYLIHRSHKYIDRKRSKNGDWIYIYEKRNYKDKNDRMRGEIAQQTMKTAEIYRKNKILKDISNNAEKMSNAYLNSPYRKSINNVGDAIKKPIGTPIADSNAAKIKAENEMINAFDKYERKKGTNAKALNNKSRMMVQKFENLPYGSLIKKWKKKGSKKK